MVGARLEAQDAASCTRNKSRDSQWRRFTYLVPTSYSAEELDAILQQPPEKFMIDELIAGNGQGFRIEELTKQDTDNYRAHQEVIGRVHHRRLPAAG